jgi:hypothetical protein
VSAATSPIPERSRATTLRIVSDDRTSRDRTHPASAEPASAEPISCTLEAAEVPDRLARWQRLATHVVDRTVTDDGVRVRFDNLVSAGEVADLAAAEQGCCSFFAFTLHIAADGTTLDVGAPAEARELVDMLLTAG